MATKKIKSKTPYTSKKSVLLIIAVLIVLVGGYFAVGWVQAYNSAADQANIVSIRELIINAVRGLKKDAPIDPKTGDVYFPEARLYLPNPDTPQTLTYLNDAGDGSDSKSEISVSTYPVFGTANLYEARNIKQLFDAVPKFQACARGVKLVYKQFPSSDTTNVLQRTVHLNNGKTLYVYQEKNCPELGNLSIMMKNLKSY
ncbi:MAG TPA: hypothetical protein VLG47_00735 [Candidatus Saccharimonadales bacterium]|nr:hypothetical protein [Candidatus Saccharimonadales bacterium]